MTAFPDHDAVADAGRFRGFATAPQVRETFWGYEITPNEQVIDIAVIGRIALLLLGVGCAVAALAAWIIPAHHLSGDVFLTRLSLSAIFVGLAVLIVTQVSPGARVRLQVDTRSGELREVMFSLTGEETVLATYGFDAVREVISHVGDDEKGQLLLVIDGVGAVPAGDGDPQLLSDLKARLRDDLGVGAMRPARPRVFGGPLRRTA